MNEAKTRSQIFTIPNILSMIRILLIPVIVYLYCVEKRYGAAVLILLLSGLTDVVDGFIARHFHMVSDVGKVLDPIADKLTQLATLVCLATKFPQMNLLFFALAIKELILGVMGLVAIKRTHDVHGANWHGKVSTCLLYLTMALHIFWVEITAPISYGLVGACLCMMLVSFVLYFHRHLLQLRETKKTMHKID